MAAKKAKKQRNKAIAFILVLIIIINIAFLIFFLNKNNTKEHKKSEIKQIALYAEVNYHKLGIDAGKTMINFGILPPEATSKAAITIENTKQSKVNITITVKGNISRKVKIIPKSFLLLPNSTKAVSFIFYAGHEQPNTKFNGTAYIAVSG